MSGIRTVAWGLWIALVAMVALASYLGFNRPSGPAISVLDAVWAASFIGFPTAGALILPRISKRPVGWILLLAPLSLMIGVNLSELAPHFQEQVMVARWLLWTSNLSFSAGSSSLLIVLFYLPDGHLPSPRWRSVTRIAWALVPLTVLHSAFKPGPLNAAIDGPMNPVSVDALKPIFDAFEATLAPLLFGIAAAGLVSLIARFRTARGTERQQMKWLALGGTGAVGAFAMLAFVEFVFGDLSDQAATLFIVVAILSVPTSIASAVLKTRLYDIDVIINRTLVYGTLTAILAITYFGIVVLLQRMLEPVTRQSDLAVAGSTLAVAALARPVLRHVQGFIDRRFYRSKYDAAETLGQFSSRLRDQVDLDSLSAELVGVVGATMQPAHASLWLRSGSPS